MGEGLPADSSSSRPRGRGGAQRESLAPGTLLESFEIVRPLGCGGFGTVYLAHDRQLDRNVAIKEYLPLQLAYRAEGLRVEVRSQELAATYAAGLRSFVNEARILARFDHPAIVKVHRFWEANGTAYMVMPWVSGPTLIAMRRLMRRAPTEAWLRGVVDPLLALAMLHEQGIYHRDIAPDNVLLPGEQAPVLLDFGAARRVIGDRTQSFTSVLKPSFAPIEQYAQARQLRQGPWTDLYALGAVCVYMLTALPPPPAAARAVHDELDRLLRPAPAGVSASFLAAIRWALELRPTDRPQSVQEFRAALDGLIEVPPPRPGPMVVAAGMEAPLRAPEETAPPELAAPRGRPPVPPHAPAVPASFSSMEALAFARAWEPTLRLGAPASAAGPAVSLPQLAARPATRSTLLASVAALAMVVAGAAIFLARGPADPGAATWRALAQHAAAQGQAGPSAAPPTTVGSSTSAEGRAPTTRVEEAVEQALGHAGPVVRTLIAVPAADPAKASTLSARQVAPMSPRSDRPASHAGKSKGSSAVRGSGPQGPRETCGGRNVFSMAACVERRCNTARLRHHPQCVELRRPPEFRWLQHEQA